MQKQFILYGTSACHLCEDAETLIQAIQIKHDFILNKVDIVEDNTLMQKYALTIPVIRCIHTGHELNWPFNEDTINSFINSQ